MDFDVSSFIRNHNELRMFPFMSVYRTIHILNDLGMLKEHIPQELREDESYVLDSIQRQSCR